MSRADETPRSGSPVTTAVRSAQRNRALDVVLSLPTWAAILTIWFAGRLLSTFWLALAWPLIGRAQPAIAIRGNDHGFLSFLTSWDGQYYQDISLHGYPTILPLDAAGHVMQNAWAFLPLFPYTIRALTASTGLPFEVGAPAIATLAGLAAAYLLHALVKERAGATAAMWGVFFFCVGPLSFLLQVGYAESLFLALLFGGLVAMQRRRYGVLTVLGVLAAFTRPGALALPLALGVVALVRWIRARRVVDGRRSWEGFPIREQIAVVVSGAVMALAGGAWPIIASHVTGVPNAYLDTEMSWWVAFVGRVHFVPLSPWFLNSYTWLGVGGVVIVVFMIIGYAVWLMRRSTRRLGLETVVFSAGYALYILAVSLPMASTPRLVMPLAPLMASPELTARPWRRWIMVTCALVGQPVLIAVLWLLGPP